MAVAVAWALYRWSPLLVDLFLSVFAVQGIEERLSISTYIGFHVMLFAVDALLVLVPLVTYGALRAGIIDAASLGETRRVVIPTLLLLSAMVTPPDPATMLIAALPLWLFFEAALLLHRLTSRKEGRRAQRQAGQSPRGKR
jgi:sec-independent protein translocase protein TatC